MKTLRVFLKEFEDPEFYNKLDIKIRHNIIDCLFIFCAVWSLGGSVNTAGRKPMDLYMKKIFCGDIKFPPEIPTKKISIPDRGLLYDYRY